MKKKTCLPLVLLFSLLICSCSSLFNFSSLPERAYDIEKGMTKQEVSSRLGKPQYRRFNDDVEQWEYRVREAVTNSDNVVVVSFVDGYVTAMDSFKQYAPPQPPESSAKN